MFGISFSYSNKSAFSLKNEINISFNGEEKIISFDELFKPRRFFDLFTKRLNKNTVVPFVPSIKKDLKIIDTEIFIPGFQKTLKFYVEKKTEKLHGRIFHYYNYWPKNVRLIRAALEKENDLSFDNHTLKINHVTCPILMKRGSYNNRSLIAIGSTHPAYDQEMLYSVSLINENDYKEEVTELKSMILIIDDFLSVNEKFSIYRNHLGFPCFIKDKPLEQEKKTFRIIYTKMLNGGFGNLKSIQHNQIKDQLDVKYQLEDVKYAYEGLLLLFAAGFCHNDIKPQNIVKNSKGFFLIDFSFMEKIKRQKLIFKGTPEFMSPEKYGIRDYEYNPIANDVFAFCLSFILPYLSVEINDIHSLNERQITIENHAFDEKINKIYSNNDPLNIALKRMGHFFFTLLNSSSCDQMKEYHQVTYFVGFIAKGLGISDSDLVSKAMSNSKQVETDSVNFEGMKDSDCHQKNAFLSEIKKFIRMNTKLASYLHCLFLFDEQEIASSITNQSAIHPEKLSDKWENLEQVTAKDAIIQIEHIKQAYEGLLLLFGAGYIHGDIKPDNIVKNETGFLLANFNCSEKIKKEGFSIKGTKGFIYRKKRFAANCDFNSVENDLYAFCLTFIFPYLGDSASAFTGQCFLGFFKNYQNRKVFFEKIDEIYSIENSTGLILKEMYSYCFALSNKNQTFKNTTLISWNLIDFAWKLGIRDVRLVGKAVENSRVSNYEQEVAIKHFKNRVKNERSSPYFSQTLEKVG